MVLNVWHWTQTSEFLTLDSPLYLGKRVLKQYCTCTTWQNLPYSRVYLLHSRGKKFRKSTRFDVVHGDRLRRDARKRVGTCVARAARKKHFDTFPRHVSPAKNQPFGCAVVTGKLYLRISIPPGGIIILGYFYRRWPVPHPSKIIPPLYCMWGIP